MPITKAHFIDALYNNVGYSRAKSTELVESLLKIIKTTLESGEDVLISGFGKFCVREKKERRGRNPATGRDLLLRKRRVITFKCSSVLRDKMNGKDGASPG